MIILLEYKRGLLLSTRSKSTKPDRVVHRFENNSSVQYRGNDDNGVAAQLHESNFYETKTGLRAQLGRFDHGSQEPRVQSSNYLCAAEKLSVQVFTNTGNHADK